jgi:hypothetical protein
MNVITGSFEGIHTQYTNTVFFSNSLLLCCPLDDVEAMAGYYPKIIINKHPNIAT